MKFLVVKGSRLLKTVIATLCVMVLLLGVSLTGAAAVYGNKTTRKLPIYSVERADKVVSLSFDASWGADKTETILSILQKYNIKANYFVVGFWAEKHSDILKKLSDSGLVEVGTHSNTHPHLPKLPKSQIELELKTSKEIIENVTAKKVDLFRPPFGDYSDSLLDIAENMGLYTIQWDVDTLDWKELPAQAMADRVMQQVKNGSIVLMHNDGKNTAQALPIIIQGLINKGYSFSTIGELIYKDNYVIDHTGRQTRR